MSKMRDVARESYENCKVGQQVLFNPFLNVTSIMECALAVYP